MIDRIVVWALRLRDERGQDLVEYSAIAGLMAVAIVAGLALFTPFINNFFTGLGTWLGNLPP